MHPVFAIGGPIAHWAAVLPILACMWGLARDRPPRADAWFLAAAFGVSWVQDQVGSVIQAQHLNTWWLSYLFAPVQTIMFLLALLEHRAMRIVAISAIGSLAILSALRGPMTEPETVVEVTGCFAIAFVAVHHRRRKAVWTYCLGTLPAILAMAMLPITSTAWIGAWIVYQSARVLGLGIMTWLIVKEIHYGSGYGDRPNHGARTQRNDRSDLAYWRQATSPRYEQTGTHYDRAMAALNALSRTVGRIGPAQVRGDGTPADGSPDVAR